MSAGEGRLLYSMDVIKKTGTLTAFLIFILLDILILFFWESRRKRKDKSLKWYWGLISPMLVICSVFALTVGLFLGTSFVQKHLPFKEKRTLKEMEEIKKAALKYDNEKRELPSSLSSLIGTNPLRLEWEKDDWESDYIYENNRLISPGKDKKPGTADDIILEIKLNSR